MGKITYVATPIGEINSPHWRNVMQLPSEDSIVVVGLQLRDLAASLGTGGRLVHPDGTPMDIWDFSRVLGRSQEMLQLALTALQRVGVVTPRGVTWCVTDAVTVDHFARVKSLSIPDKEERKKALGRERSRRCRAAKKTASNANLLQLQRYEKRYNDEQPPKITEENNVTINNKNNSLKNTTTTFPSNLQEVIKRISSTALSSKLKALIWDNYESYGPEYVASNIQYALKNHKPTKGQLGGMIRQALNDDYAKEEREAIKAEERRKQNAAAKKLQQKLVEAEQQEHEQQARIETQQLYEAADEGTKDKIRNEARRLLNATGASSKFLAQTIQDVAHDYFNREANV